jgi:hypothetical protein
MKFLRIIFDMIIRARPPRHVAGGNQIKTMERKNMKTISKAILVAALGLAVVPAVKASTGYDLLMGFTQQGANSTGNDFIFDIGPYVGYPGATALYNGEQWNLGADLSAQGFNLSDVQWGVIGDANSGDGANPETMWVTSAGLAPKTINGDSAFQQTQVPVNAIMTDFGADGQTTFTTPGQSATPSATTQNSWNEQTISGTLATQFVNSYGNPNVTGETSDVLWQVSDDNSAPIDLGTLSLSNQGVLTFTAVPEPGTLGLISMGGLLVLGWRYRFNRSKA